MMPPAEGFIPEKYRFILICIDSYDNKQIKGRLYNPYAHGKSFDNLMQMILLLGDLLEQSAFPQSFLKMRSFCTKDAWPGLVKRTNPVFDEVEKAPLGELATFKLRVIFRQNASWQGVVSWLENNTEANFRSAMELFMLLDSALTQVGAQLELKL